MKNIMKTDADLTLYERATGQTLSGHSIQVYSELPERKELGPSGFPMGPSLFDSMIIQSGAFAQLSFLQGMNLYLACSPLFNAIDRLAQEVSNIDPVVVDRKSGKQVDDHPILELLDMPNPIQDYQRFMYALTTWYLICGNAFPVATGNVKFDPLEIWLALPPYVTGIADADGLPLSYKDRETQYTREDVKRRWRFYSEDGMREMWPVRAFMPGVGGQQLFGVSPLIPCFLEIEQYNYANIHNLSLLKRGARPSFLFSAEGELSDKQYTRLQEQVNQFYTGAQNAGRPLLGEGGITAEALMQNARDMDFLNLKTDQRDRIYTTLKIPLSLISEKSMTYDNVENGTLALYQQAVMPLAKTILGSLSRWLMPRYKGSERLELTFDEKTIPALRYRRMQEASLMAKVPVFMDNEVREAAGYEPYPGGDVIFRPKLLTATDEEGKPVQTQAEDPNATRDKDDIDGKEPSVRRSAARKYRQLLLDQKAGNGQPLYTYREVEELVQRHFGADE